MKKTVYSDDKIMVQEEIKVNGEAAAPQVRRPVYVDSEINPYGRNLLSAVILFKTDGEAWNYSYTIRGATPETSFTYTSDTFEVDPEIPIIGIYATRSTPIDFTFTNHNGDVNTDWTITFLYYTYTDFGNHYLKTNFEITDQDMANSSIANGWLFNGYYGDIYDANGDVRVIGLLDEINPNLPMKVHNNLFYVPTNPLGGVYYTKQYDKLTLMGENKGSIVAPDGFGFHHDLTWDNDGYVYCLASTIEEPTPTMKREGLILKYVDATGELVASIDYNELYYGSSCVRYAAPNDVHFNTIEYVPEIDQILVNSRNSSSYFGIDKRSMLPIWNVENPAHNLILPESFNLKVLNPDEYVYVSGAHTTFVTHNPKYDAYRGENRIVVSIFDNVACVDENGNELFAPNEDVRDENVGYQWDSAVQIVAIDLNNRTIEQLDRFTIPGERSDITSNVFDTEDNKYFQVYYGVPTDYFVMDANGRVGVAAKQVRIDLDPSYIYRGRVFSYPVINNLVEGKELYR